MNHPSLTSPLFLSRISSDQSQSKRWRTVLRAPSRRRRISAAVRFRSRGRDQAAPTTATGASAMADTTTTPVTGGTPGAPSTNGRGALAPTPAGRSDAGHGSGETDRPAAPAARRKAFWAIVITGMALFMASLDNLVVSTALPVIRVHLHAGLSGLEWTVNAYTLTFAVLLLSAAAIGERFGRRRIFVLGIAVFTAASAVAALAPSISVLVAARAVQGAGGAMIMPLSLTLLSAAVTPERRNAALGLWGAIGGMAVAIGPLVGGAVTSGWSWQFIFWLNVPIGVVLVPLAWWKLSESRGTPSPPRPGGGGVGERRPVRRGARPGPGQRPRVDERFGSGVVRDRGACPDRLHRLGAQVLPSDAEHQALPPPWVRGGERHRPVVQLRDVRLDLLPDPVPPDRPGPQPAGGRCEGAALDGDGHAVGPAGRQPGRALGGKATGGERAGHAGHRPQLAGPAHHADHSLRRHGGALRGQRRGHDPVLRPAGIPGARIAAYRPRRGGLRSEQRLSRAGRGVGHRRARCRVQRQRWLPLGCGLRERADPGGVRRSRGGGGRSGHRAARSGPASPSRRPRRAGAVGTRGARADVERCGSHAAASRAGGGHGQGVDRRVDRRCRRRLDPRLGHHVGRRVGPDAGVLPGAGLRIGLISPRVPGRSNPSSPRPGVRVSPGPRSGPGLRPDGSVRRDRRSEARRGAGQRGPEDVGGLGPQLA